MTRKPGWARIVDALRSHPGATHGELDELTGLEGITQRISDARAHGYTIECVETPDRFGRRFKRYWLREPEPVQLSMEVA